MKQEDIATFFQETTVRVVGNESLRIPQIEGYIAILEHFNASHESCYVQLPVGCGKTGLMGITPFGLAHGRVLIIAPNVTIREIIVRELNISSPRCFYRRLAVLGSTLGGPFVTELKGAANVHDCHEAHIVVANIQQFSGTSERWYHKLPSDFFDLVLVDEGHHNVAQSWRDLFEYFGSARVVSFTATPQRSDGQVVSGKRVYRFGYAQSMLMGYISPVDAALVSPEQLTFSVRGETRSLSLTEVLELREQDWFSRGIALSDVCNRHIVEASIDRLHKVREYGTPRQIIAACCSIRHANHVKALYHEYGLKAEVISSELAHPVRERIEAELTSGQLDAIVQVQMLGEGFDLGTLSIAAIFRPYRSLSPYIQFVGRVLRLADPMHPNAQGNRAYVVSHVGMNDERWWDDFKQFDADDQSFFSNLLKEDGDSEGEVGDGGPRLTLRPFLKVLSETVESYRVKGYLKKVDDAMVAEVMKTIRSYGFDPLEFGITEEFMRFRLMAAAASESIPASPMPVQPQKRREALRIKLGKESRSIADAVLNRLCLPHHGGQLKRLFPGAGPTNLIILIRLAEQRISAAVGEAREAASIEQLEAGLAAVPNVVDQLQRLIAVRLGRGGGDATIQEDS